jgi:hypothetical protein
MLTLIRRWFRRKPPEPAKLANITPRRVRPRGQRFDVELLADLREGAGAWKDEHRTGTEQDWQDLGEDLSSVVERHVANAKAEQAG